MNQNGSASGLARSLQFTKFENAEQAYSKPIAFLPLESKIVRQQTSSVDPETSLHAAIHDVCRRAAKTTAILKSYLVSQSEVPHLLKTLQSSLADASRILSSEFGKPSSRSNQRARKISAKALADSQLANRLCDYKIYDHYFNVVRVPSMSTPQLGCQVASTCLEVSADLSFSALAIDQISTVTETIRAMFEYLAAELGLNEKPASSSKKRALVLMNESSHSTWWLQAPKVRSEERKRWSRRIALYRWCVGHHLFNLCSIVCGSHLKMAGQAIDDSDENKAAAFILEAAKFRRGGTAAMCYAASFPAEIYLDYVRPSMSEAGAPNGFSGSQNSDYNQMKIEKKQLGEKIRKRYGIDSKTWPAPIRSAANVFQEAEIEDSEHHVLIAVSKVGPDSSLAQKKWQRRLPSEMPVKHAADILRDMVEMKRRGDGL